MNYIHPAPIRDTVQVRFPNGRAYDGPKGTTIEEFLQYTTEEDIQQAILIITKEVAKQRASNLLWDRR